MINWMFHLTWRVLKLLGFESRSHKGEVDHGKFWTTVLLVSVIVAQFTGKQFAIGMVVVLGSLAYGRSMWTRFLESKTVTSTESATYAFEHKEQINKTITESRHVDEDGIAVQHTP